ncbi:MAG: antibiotic biosynthesis monooxygenase [Anaerolineales bacterium]|nr:antibiotic biosynthesis monooxygenase [Anaerolineae bacterium]PWB69766.1 MAG: antibiotic biosynthesis monooxygenase [Anaerolineales bacterium]
MYIVVVHSHIQPEHVERFREVTVENAEASRREAGCVRFDVIQQADDPTRFTFIEMFKSKEDGARHLETSHFTKWLEEAVPLMTEPRTRVIYQDVSLT